MAGIYPHTHKVIEAYIVVYTQLSHPAMRLPHSIRHLTKTDCVNSFSFFLSFGNLQLSEMDWLSDGHTPMHVPSVSCCRGCSPLSQLMWAGLNTPSNQSASPTTGQRGVLLCWDILLGRGGKLCTAVESDTWDCREVNQTSGNISWQPGRHRREEEIQPWFPSTM